jgi:hypothetical protein
MPLGEAEGEGFEPSTRRVTVTVFETATKMLICRSFTPRPPVRSPVNGRCCDAPGEALAELRRCAGAQFVPRVVEAFAAVLAERVEAGAAIGCETPVDARPEPDSRPYPAATI